MENQSMNADILSRTLITGSSGMIGKYLDFGKKTDRADLDITDLEKVLSVFESSRPLVIIHLAAQVDVDRCESNPSEAYLINTVGTYNIAYAAKKIGAKLVYLSTVGVFGDSGNQPYAEIAEPNPQNHYSRSKYLGELIVRELLKDYLIIRASWIFGGGPNGDKKFVGNLIRQFNQNEIKVVDDQFGSPIFAKDLVAAIKNLLLINQSGIVHLVNDGFCSRYEFAKEIVKIADAKVKLEPVKSNHFSFLAKKAKNEMLASKRVKMRPWPEALGDYLKTEWNF
jgi:dTDP-4-dehydrorhamnose reductase